MRASGGGGLGACSPRKILESTLSGMLFSASFHEISLPNSVSVKCKTARFFCTFNIFYTQLGRVPEWHQAPSRWLSRISHCSYTPPPPPSCSLASNGWFPIYNSCKYRAALRLSNSVANCRTLLWPERKLHFLISPVNSTDVPKKDLLRKLRSVKNFEPTKELFW